VKDDFFTTLGKELDRAAERQAGRRLLPRLHWTRRSALVLIPAMVLIAVPAFAAVTGVLRSSSRRPVNVNTLCATRSIPPPSRSTAPPPAGLLRLLGVLRRPRTPGDRYPTALNLLSGVSGVNPNSVRIAQTSPDGTRVLVIPVGNINAPPNYSPDPRCARRIPPPPPATPGVCLVTRTPTGAGRSCAAVKDFRSRGLPAEISIRGRSEVAGLVPDGVTSVSLAWRHQHRLDIPVVENTYIARVRRIGHQQMRVLWHGAFGTRVVSQGGPSISAAERRREQRSVARDRRATRTPNVLPAVGRAATIFTMRVRAPLPDSVHGTYVMTLRGPLTGDCGRLGRRMDIVRPNSFGKSKGVIALGYFPAGMGFSRRWCKGTYRGSIELWPHGKRRGFGHRPYGHFSFEVR
jgi:hypothetical protein